MASASAGASSTGVSSVVASDGPDDAGGLLECLNSFTLQIHATQITKC